MDETRVQDRGEAGTVGTEALDEAPPLPQARLKGGVGQPIRHDSGSKHVSGEARYLDDDPELPGTLQVYLAMSPKAHARIRAMDLAPVRMAEGVVCVLSAEDVPGINDYSPVFGDDPIFADGIVQFVGQPLFAVAAPSLKQARAAAKLAVVDYEDLPAAVTMDEGVAFADAAGEDLLTPHEMRLGDAAAALAGAPHVVEGRVETGGQDHFYLEGQIAYAWPQEDGDQVRALDRFGRRHDGEAIGLRLGFGRAAGTQADGDVEAGIAQVQRMCAAPRLLCHSLWCWRMVPSAWCSAVRCACCRLSLPTKIIRAGWVPTRFTAGGPSRLLSARCWRAAG